MLNAQITTCFVTSFWRSNEVTRTLEAKLAETRKQFEAARLRARRRHRMLMKLGVSERRMWMLRRPQGAIFWSSVLENFTADQWRQHFCMLRATFEFVLQDERLQTGENPLNHAIDWQLFCGGMLPLASTAQSFWCGAVDCL